MGRTKVGSSRRGGEGVGRPEGFGVVDLFGPDGVEDGFVFVGVEDVLAEDAEDDDGADVDEVVLGVEVVEGGVFGAVELGEDEVADMLGVGEPAGCRRRACRGRVAMAARAMRPP